MAGPDPNGISPSDTGAEPEVVAELERVYKTYFQKQRSERLRDTLSGLLRPRVRKVEALRDVSMQLRRGEVVAYAGPNGAGKSTTIKLLSGLLAPDAGRVRALGLDPVRDRVRYVGRIGVVFGQRTELWWDHPVAASFEWKRVVWDIPRERYERMLGWTREALEIEPFFHSLARELSLGQRMRADLALALLHEPELLLLDEPTLGLDVLARRAMIRMIRRLNAERRLTVLVTSHDMEELEELAGRVVMVHQGRIAFDGDWDRLRRELGDRRRLVLRTDAPNAPELRGASVVDSRDGRHEYVFDASTARIADLLAQASAQAEVLDVETHRAPIDDVTAEIYERWQSAAFFDTDGHRRDERNTEGE